jgi:SAM-dependent methyltransferase
MAYCPCMPSEPSLTLTGERTVPGIPEENYWFRRHEAAYLRLADQCRGAVVLEAGCGEGYGAALLARHARLVVGLDYDAAAAAHAAARYPHVRVARGNLACLPVADSTVDVVANLQVIEHLWDQAEFLAECARVLRPGGRLLVSTPNRITFSPGRDTPLNPFHTRELSAAELVELLVGVGFTVRAMLGLRHGPALRALDAEHGGSLIDAQVAVALGGGGEWPAGLRAAVAGVRADDFEIDDERLDESLDLIALADAPARR